MISWIKLINWAKVFAVVAFMSTLFGVAFQKGMIESMGFGNMSGNYQIEEIAASAINAYVMFIMSVFEIDNWKLVLTNSYVVPVMVAIGLLVWFKDKKAEQIDAFKAKSKVLIQNKAKEYFQSGPKVTIISTFIGLLVGLATGLFKYALIAACMIFLLPIYISFLFGQKFIGDMVTSSPCVAVSEKTVERKIARQCTQLTFKGNELEGRIIMERQDGFFLQTNEAFLFINKNGEQCIYSGYLTKEVMKDKKPDELNFTSPQIQNICIDVLH